MSFISRCRLTGSCEQRLYYLTFACLFVLQLGPIWSAPYPAMHDYPNHLARAVILHEYSDNESYHAAYEYEPHWWLIPNLAIDLVVPMLMKVVEVETASRLFLSLIVLVFDVGVHMVGRAINTRPHWNAPVSTVFLYNFFWSMGLPNYLLGLGLFLITLAVWLRYRQAWTMGRVFMIAVLAVTCYASHLSAFVFFGVSVACLTGFDTIRTKAVQTQHIVGLLPLVAPTLAYLWYTSDIPQKSAMEWWQPILMKKITGLLYPFLSYNLVFDAALGLVFTVLVVLSLKWTGQSRVNRELLLVGGVLVLLYAVMPMSGGVQSTYVDRRIIVPAAVLLTLAVRIDLSKRVGHYLLLGLMCLCVIRVAEVWHYWNRIGHDVRGQVQMLEHLPEGARLYPMFVHDQSSTRSWLWDMHFFHTAHYATIFRHAFVPTLYAWRSAFPIHLRSPNTGYVQIERGTPLEEVKWDVISSQYDYLFGHELPLPFREFLLANGEVVAEQGAAMLIRFKKE